MIISYNIGGLANRMKAISSGYRLLFAIIKVSF